MNSGPGEWSQGVDSWTERLERTFSSRPHLLSERVVPPRRKYVAPIAEIRHAFELEDEIDESLHEATAELFGYTASMKASGAR